jgi:DNA adenine methylase
MIDKNIIRSPLFYVGDKYKLIDEIKSYFPTTINRLIEPFVGGGSVFLNVKANSYLLNDIDAIVIDLHKYLCLHSSNPHAFIEELLRKIKGFGLSCSFVEDIIPDEIKKRHKKTYYAVYNKNIYQEIKNKYNNSNDRPIDLLYLLKIYGFNRMHRFNKNNEFNVPVGNVDFNKNVVNALNNYFSYVRNNDISWFCLDFKDFIDSISFQNNDLVYLDPPYLITFSEYNKLWNEQTEKELLELLDRLNQQGIKFAISNVTHYKGRINELFLNWSKDYHCHDIKSNYISYHDNSIKTFKEVLITNF